MGTPWIGVDLDGTLAEYNGWEGIGVIGNPIYSMIERVKNWIHIGYKVKIFTARVSMPQDGWAIEDIVLHIQRWSGKHIGYHLEVTCIKDFDMIELWDDRCVAVERNTGIQLSPSSRGLR